MLHSSRDEFDAVRFSTPDSLEQYVAGAPAQIAEVSREAALEENFFLGLRLNEGVDLAGICAKFGNEVVSSLSPLLADLAAAHVVDRQADRIRLTARGRLLSNEVFERFLTAPHGAGTPAREAIARETGA